jgi:hypothetical protein
MGVIFFSLEASLSFLRLLRSACMMHLFVLPFRFLPASSQLPFVQATQTQRGLLGVDVQIFRPAADV